MIATHLYDLAFIISNLDLMVDRMSPNTLIRIEVVVYQFLVDLGVYTAPRVLSGILAPVSGGAINKNLEVAARFRQYPVSDLNSTTSRN